MSTISDELFEIANRLDLLRTKFDQSEVKRPLEKLENEANKAGKAWSGSWLGYHSRVYYRDLQPPPPGARFSQEWGFMDVHFGDTRGDWVEYDFDVVRDAIYKSAGDSDLTAIEKLAETARSTVEDSQTEIASLLTTALEDRDDPFISKIKEEAESLRIPSVKTFIEYFRPSGNIISRDMPAIGQGLISPPHIVVLARVIGLRSPANACESLGKLAKQAASHLAKRERYARRKQEIGTNVFIGHGRSSAWKDLKDFIQDRLGLPWDEFNRVPVAGITNIARLSQMLDDAAIAFLIMTAEDEQADGKRHARMNVVHEAGLFQGKLGFTKAIVLLEEGCEEFSNIQGLGQIHFPKGNIKAVFEDVRQVLEREGVIAS
jgi:predicted nucleotide-binding protein